jgi:hypothetical protein
MELRKFLLAGQVIPAHPLALDQQRRFSEKHQRALTRYYLGAGVGGLAVAVHSTQFEIREAKHGLLRPVLELAAATAAEELRRAPRELALVAGVCGGTAAAVAEAELARSLGYHAALVSMTALDGATEAQTVDHLRAVARVLPVIGFYLQPAVGGRVFSVGFWRSVLLIENVVAVKIAPFNRYQTLDVVRAAVETGRDDVALYTGNDDTIVSDLLTPFTFARDGKPVTRRIVGGLLGHWGVWTKAAVDLFHSLQAAVQNPSLDASWWANNAAVTDMNAAVFDSAHKFAGCIPGILEVLRRQGLVPTALCLNPHEVLSPGQADELTRVAGLHPALTDDPFVAENLDRWLK